MTLYLYAKEVQELVVTPLEARIEALEQALRDIDQIICEEWHRHHPPMPNSQMEKMIAAILDRTRAHAALAQTGESTG